MADSPNEKPKELSLPNPVADQRHREDEIEEVPRNDDEKPAIGSSFVGENDEKRAELNRMRTNGTNTSVTTAATIHPHAEQKPWYKQPNPLRWGKIEPIPETRRPSPEHNASFFNSLFFSWMGPLMSVGERGSERVMCTLVQPLTTYV